MIDEELLKTSRDHLARINEMIAAAEREMVEKIERYGSDDAEYSYQHYKEYYAKIDPLRRERDAVVKVIADYYGAQPMPPVIVART